MLNTVLLDYLLRVAARVEGASENLGELLVKATNAQLLKAHILFEELLGFARVDFDGSSGLLTDFEAEDGVLVNYTVVERACMIQSVERVDGHCQNNLTVSDSHCELFTSVQLFRLKEGTDSLTDLCLVETKRFAWLPWHLVVDPEDIDAALYRRQRIRRGDTRILQPERIVNLGDAEGLSLEATGADLADFHSIGLLEL